ncbi:type II toxin-antitoxin system Phd/YefM family antitoxin [Roseomonas aeriglobus]|nr:type II toxin-antitoxin system Phd/YefM family antitoxin [Roseomonas aeriglobus]
MLISASEWASIEETLYLLRSPKNAERLLESIRELEAGGGEEHELIRRERPVLVAILGRISRHAV